MYFTKISVEQKFLNIQLFSSNIYLYNVYRVSLNFHRAVTTQPTDQVLRRAHDVIVFL